MRMHGNAREESYFFAHLRHDYFQSSIFLSGTLAAADLAPAGPFLCTIVVAVFACKYQDNHCREKEFCLPVSNFVFYIQIDKQNQVLQTTSREVKPL